jgi:excisionase family DNA binding protein
MMAYSSGTPALVGYDGGATELTDEAYRTMRMVLRVVQGVGDGSEEADPYVSTGQAAEILGVSARTVARYLDAGDIPCERRGTGHRRARLSDVLAYKETRSARATIMK